MHRNWLRRSLFASVASIALLPAGHGIAQQAKPAEKAPSAESIAAAGDIADFFRKVGDQIYDEDCIFELSEEQLEVQRALIEAYIKHGAPDALARQLAVKQIRPPKLSDKCRQLKKQNKTALPNPASLPDPGAPIAPPSAPITKSWSTNITLPKKAPEPLATEPVQPAHVALADKRVLPQWDCAPGIDYVTIQHKGFERKLSDGEICSPFEDVVRQVPATVKTFKIGYAIKSGRVFVVSDDPAANGKTIAWAISGREACRNNPDPDCLAARAVGPLPPGEYSFASDKSRRVSWGPTSKRMVAGIYLTKLWYRERYTPAQAAAILARGNIAIHVRLKGEMSEACLGLGHNGWAYVSSLIKDGRATGVQVYIDEPHPQIAERPPIVTASSFSLSSLFK